MRLVLAAEIHNGRIGGVADQFLIDKRADEATIAA